jgi:hypothetical protein
MNLGGREDTKAVDAINNRRSLEIRLREELGLGLFDIQAALLLCGESQELVEVFCEDYKQLRSNNVQEYLVLIHDSSIGTEWKRYFKGERSPGLSGEEIKFLRGCVAIFSDKPLAELSLELGDVSRALNLQETKAKGTLRMLCKRGLLEEVSEIGFRFKAQIFSYLPWLHAVLEEI